MKKLYTLIILAVFGLVNLAQAQQYPYYYQYLMNRYSLSPAYGGVYGITEAYLGYRQNMLNTTYAPKTLMFNINTPVAKKSGVGLNIINDQADIFSNLYVIGSYSYHLQVAKDHFIDFAINGGMNQKRVDLSGALNNPLVDPNDPMFQGGNEISETSLEFGGGLMYRWKKLNIGLNVPSFAEVNSEMYQTEVHWISYISYDFKIDTNWYIEPVLVNRTVNGAPTNFEVSAMARYKEKIWFGPTYRSNYIGALSIGALVAKNIVFMYSYDFSLPFGEYKGVLGSNSAGGHEISLGYRFGNRGGAPKEKPATAAQVDSLAQATDSLNKQVKALSDSLAKLKTYPDPNPAIQDLDRQVKELNALLLAQGAGKDIERIAKTVYFVSDGDQLTDYSKNKLNELVDILKKYPTFRLEIEGHTDNTASEEHNQKLSEKRAKSVVDYLVSKGIDRSRMNSAGYGESRPVDTNNTKEGRQNNRRTEIKAY